MFTNAIITFTKGKILITAEENEKLKRVRAEDWFACSKGNIKGSAIAEIITITEYYDRYPNERQEERKLFIAPPKEEYESIEDKASGSKTRSIGILSGLKKYCAEHPEGEIAKEIYKRKLSQHMAKFGGSDEHIPAWSMM